MGVLCGQSEGGGLVELKGTSETMPSNPLM